jgi:hypothetical protein
MYPTTNERTHCKGCHELQSVLDTTRLEMDKQIELLRWLHGWLKTKQQLTPVIDSRIASVLDAVCVELER